MHVRIHMYEPRAASASSAMPVVHIEDNGPQQTLPLTQPALCAWRSAHVYHGGEGVAEQEASGAAVLCHVERRQLCPGEIRQAFGEMRETQDSAQGVTDWAGCSLKFQMYRNRTASAACPAIPAQAVQHAHASTQHA
jgi:hypothetical protein